MLQDCWGKMIWDDFQLRQNNFELNGWPFLWLLRVRALVTVRLQYMGNAMTEDTAFSAIHRKVDIQILRVDEIPKRTITNDDSKNVEKCHPIKGGCRVVLWENIVPEIRLNCVCVWLHYMLCDLRLSSQSASFYSSTNWG